MLSIAFFLPISQKASTISIIITLALALLLNHKKKVRTKEIRQLLPFLLLFFLFSISKYRDDYELGLRLFEQKAVMLALPIMFIASTITKVKFEHIIKAFVIGCFVTYALLFLNALVSAIDFKTLSFNPFVDAYKNSEELFLNEQPLQTNLFLGRSFATIMQPTLLSVYFLFALVCLNTMSLGFSKKLKRALSAIFVLAVIQIFSLIAIIGLIISLYIIISRNIDFRVSLLVLFGFLAILTTLTVYPSIEKNKRLSVVMNNTGNRLVIWNAALSTISEKPIFGHGKKNAQKRLESYYPKRGHFGAISQSNKIDAHNVILQTILEIGLIGLALLILVFFNLFKLPRTKELIAFFTLTVLVSMTESILNIYVGVSFFCFFSCLFLNKAMYAK